MAVDRVVGGDGVTEDDVAVGPASRLLVVAAVVGGAAGGGDVSERFGVFEDVADDGVAEVAGEVFEGVRVVGRLSPAGSGEGDDPLVVFDGQDDAALAGGLGGVGLDVDEREADVGAGAWGPVAAGGVGDAMLTSRSGVLGRPSPSSHAGLREPRPEASMTRSAVRMRSSPLLLTRSPVTRVASPTSPSAVVFSRIVTFSSARTRARSTESRRSREQTRLR